MSRPRSTNFAPRAALALACALAAALGVRAAPAVVQRPHSPAAGMAAVRGAVWSLAFAADGSLLVGSNALGAYDGTAWSPVALPEGAYAVRALAPGADGRVWVGRIGALGYAARDAAGAWRFTSLLPELYRADRTTPGDVWAVQAAGAGAVWVTSDRILRWMPGTTAGVQGTFETWTRPAPLRLLGFPSPDGLWVFQEGAGLLHIGAAGAPKLVCPAAELPAQPVTWLVAPAAPDGAGLAGLGDRAWAWDGARRFEPLGELSAALRGTVPQAALRLGERRVAIGTFKAGIVLAETTADRARGGTAAGVVATIAAAQGLDDDKVNALAGDEAGLWVGGTEGLVRVAGPGCTVFFDRARDLAHGVAHTVVEHRGTTFAATRRHLFRLAAGDTFVPEPGGPPELHALAAGATALWAGGFGGVWRTTAGAREQLYHATGDVPGVAASERFPEGALFLDGYDLKALRPTATGFAVDDLGARVGDTPAALHEDAAGDVWVTTLATGLRRFGWRESAARRPQLRLQAGYRPRAGLPAGAGGARLVPVGPRLFAFSDAGILALNAAGNAFEPVAELADFHGLAAANAPAAAEGELVGYWLVRPKAAADPEAAAVLRVRCDLAGPVRWEPLAAPGLEHVGIVAAAAWIGSETEPALWVSGSRGLLAVQAGALRTARPPPELPPLLADGAVTLGNGELALPGTARRIAFAHRVPGAQHGEPVFYQTRLAPAEEAWSAPGRDADRAFENLAPGRYVFHARALDAFGRAGPGRTLAFVVPAPWWRTPAAFAGYAALALAAGAGIARWRGRHLRRQNERLNRLVAERTREIELASTAKSEFLENVGHEIRNPLNGLSGLLRRLDDERFGPRERDLTRSLRAVAADLQRVCEEVLSFSRLEYGGARMRRRPFRLRALLREVIALFAPVARTQGCALGLEWAGADDDAFEGDDNKIRTVVSNFLANALRYAPGAPVTLRVDAHPREQGEVELYLEVRDAGPGVPAEEQELIFKKFVRGTAAARTGAAGTGLGLATCRVLAQVLGGNVGVESPIVPATAGRPAHGALFYLRVVLPRAAGAVPETPPPAVPPRPAGGRALIVEDESYNQAVLEGIACELGYAADLAAGAGEALERFAAGRHDLVFLDWELPGGNGGAIARRLRALPGGDAPLVLAVTAHDSDAIREACFAAGMDGYLLKPYDTAAVHALISRARARRSGGTDEPAVAPAGTTVGEERLNVRAFAHYARARPGAARPAPVLFAEALVAELAVIETAHAQGDAAAVASAAHRLRALAGLVGARATVDAAAMLEQAARDGRPADEALGRVALAATALAQRVQRLPDSPS